MEETTEPQPTVEETPPSTVEAPPPSVETAPPAEAAEPAPSPPAPAPEPEPVQYATEYERLLALAQDTPPGTWIEDDPQKPYRIGVWGRPEGKKYPNLCCRDCQFAILANRTGPYARQFMEHWGAKHEPEEDEPTAGRSGLIDASGRPL